MVESLRELNPICQKPRYKQEGNWMVRHILRDAALPITWLLLHTLVTANQVTLASLVIGLAGIMLFACPSTLVFLAGTLLLQFWYLLDHVDGQIARYRKSASLTGRFFDFMTHHLIHGVIFFSLGFYVFKITGHVFFVVWGFVASLSITMFNLAHDTKYKTFFEKVSAMKTVEILSAGTRAGKRVETEASFARQFFSLLHKLCEIHVLMNILTAAAFLQMFIFKTFDFRFFLFVLYGVIVPVIAVVKITYLITARRIDRDFENAVRQVS